MHLKSVHIFVMDGSMVVVLQLGVFADRKMAKSLLDKDYSLTEFNRDRLGAPMGAMS